VSKLGEGGRPLRKAFQKKCAPGREGLMRNSKILYNTRRLNKGRLSYIHPKAEGKGSLKTASNNKKFRRVNEVRECNSRQLPGQYNWTGRRGRQTVYVSAGRGLGNRT